MTVRDIFVFEKWLTPTLAKFVYHIGLIAAAVGGLMTVVSGVAMMNAEFGGFGPGLGTVILGLLTFVGGAVGARIVAELTLILFEIHQELRKANQRQ